jgi:hypothetical protein
MDNYYCSYRLVNKKYKETIIAHLKKLGTGEIKPKKWVFGICRELDEVCNIGGDPLVRNYAADWPKFSGHSTFPVPHSRKSATDAFIYTSNLWEATQYGDDRRELCLFLADRLEAELNKE